MSEIIRPLTPQETCAMYHYHSEYAALGIGAIAYYKGLSPRDKSFIDDMTSAILKAAQHGVLRNRSHVSVPDEGIWDAFILGTIRIFNFYMGKCRKFEGRLNAKRMSVMQTPVQV